MRCAPSTLPARGCGLGRQRDPGKVKASWGGRGPPDSQGSGPRRWDLSAQSQGGGAVGGRSNPCAPPPASRHRRRCALAPPGSRVRREQALAPSRGFSFWRELPPCRSCTENWRDVRRQQRPPARGPGPGPRPAPGSHPLPLAFAVAAVVRVPPRRRARAQGGPGAPELGGGRAVGLRGRDGGPGELGRGARPRPVPPDPPSVPGAHQLRAA